MEEHSNTNVFEFNLKIKPQYPSEWKDFMVFEIPKVTMGKLARPEKAKLLEKQ